MRAVCASQQKLAANDRFGSIASDQDSPDPACMSALSPIATKLVRRNEVTLCANCCREQMQQNDILLFDHLVGAREQRRRHFKAIIP
jgi:hypothetical protein